MQDTIVIKIGGGAGIDPRALAPEIAGLVRSGARIVIVHGGSHETNELAARLRTPPRFLTSPGGHTSRRTDDEALDIFCMAYCGRINTRFVERLRSLGVDALGLSGVDGALWRAVRKDAIRAVEDGRTVLIRDDLTGRVESVDADLLRLLLDAGRTPVLSPPAITADGVAVNVDADRAAAMTAGALGASTLLLLSNVPGVLADPDDPSSIIASAHDLDAVRAAARGRMKNKVLGAEEALRAGVGRIVIGSAQRPDAIRRALAGAGTVFEGALA
ncbi:MAG: [LysW]-aminoadipate kinase [Phycisphaerales bacterium]